MVEEDARRTEGNNSGKVLMVWTDSREEAMLRDTPGEESIAPNTETKGASKAPEIRAQ